MNIEKSREFITALITRGFGIYGPDKMRQICEDSDIGLQNDLSFILQENDIDRIINKLLINYSNVNLPARLSVVVLAKRYGINLPVEISGPKEKTSKFQRERLQ
ncbi:MAG: hypothetical protein ACXAD7_01735 [Candidatus Kariarchaeaceae archaeon]